LHSTIILIIYFDSIEQFWQNNLTELTSNGKCAVMKRDIESILTRMLDDERQREVILIEGARQVGKSTMVSQVLESGKKKFIAIDLEKDRKTARMINKTEDFNDFKALMYDRCGLRKNSILFLDEAQECQILAGYIKSFKEDWPEVRVILTGSSMNRLFSSETRIPVGRTRSLCVYPFSFSEFLRCLDYSELADFIGSAPVDVPGSRHKHLLDIYDRHLHVGGYPEAVKALAANQSAEIVIDEIIGTLQEDFARKEDYSSSLFENTIRVVSSHIGSPSKYTHINATKYYAQKVIDAMKAWHIVLEVCAHSLDPKHSNFLPKRYLHDLGIVNRYRSIIIPSLSMLRTLDPLLRTALGGLFENAVLLSLLEGESAIKQIGSWRKSSKSSVEVDFILDAPGLGMKIPIECKAALTIKRRHVDSVGEYLIATHQPFGVVVSAAPLGIVRQTDEYCILNIPIYLATKSNILSYAKQPF